MRPTSPSSSRGVSTTPSRPIELFQPPRSIPGRHLPPWIDCWTKCPHWVVLPAPTSHRRHDCGSHQVQRQQPRALSPTCVRGHANHVHLLATPNAVLPQLTKSLKDITAKPANAMLGLTGNPFWQEESYDHLVRHDEEFEKIRNYIEVNPVRAGLVSKASEYRWSSAGWATGGSPADEGVRPTSGQEI
jgi:REP element-mobilizing transposase RayT